MNQATFSDQARTQILKMSSRVLADVTHKRHQHVKRDIEVMFLQLNLDASKFGHIYFDSMNRQQTEYLLDKDMTLCLTAGYSAVMRMTIIKRWQELEQQAQNQALDLSNPYALRRALLDYTEQVIELETKNQCLEHTVKTITSTCHAVKFQQACKILGIKQPVLAKWLRSHGWDRQLNGKRASTYYSQERGYCETKYMEVAKIKANGELGSYTQIEFFILPKGMQVLAKHFGALNT